MESACEEAEDKLVVERLPDSDVFHLCHCLPRGRWDLGLSCALELFGDEVVRPYTILFHMLLYLVIVRWRFWVCNRVSEIN